MPRGLLTRAPFEKALKLFPGGFTSRIISLALGDTVFFLIGARGISAGVRVIHLLFLLGHFLATSNADFFGVIVYLAADTLIGRVFSTVLASCHVVLMLLFQDALEFVLSLGQHFAIGEVWLAQFGHVIFHGHRILGLPTKIAVGIMGWRAGEEPKKEDDAKYDDEKGKIGVADSRHGERGTERKRAVAKSVGCGQRGCEGFVMVGRIAESLLRWTEDRDFNGFGGVKFRPCLLPKTNQDQSVMDMPRFSAF